MLKGAREILGRLRANWQPDRRKATVLGACIGFVVTLLAGVTALLLPVAAQWSYDVPFAFRAAARPEGVVLVLKDDATFQQPGFRAQREWDRTWDARLIHRLVQDGARLIVFDVLYDEASTQPQADQVLAQYVGWSQRTVLAADLAVARGDAGQGYRLIPPIAPLHTNTLGLVRLLVSQDYAVREFFPGAADHGSLAWAAAARLGAPVTRDPEQRRARRWMNYYAGAGSIPSVSYHLAVDTNALPAGHFKDKVVFVGSHLSVGLPGTQKDEFRGPYTWIDQRFHPGVEIHAVQFLNLMRGDWLGRAPPALQWLAALALAAAGAGLVALRPLPAGLVALGAAAAIFVGACAGQGAGRIWFNWLAFELQLLAALAWAIVFNSIRLHFEKELLRMQTRQIEQSLKAYVSESRVRQILQQPDLLKPGVTPLYVTLLFSDIENFSKFSEGLPSDELARLLNHYYEAALKSIHETDGTVLQLIGDAIFALWNAPFPQSDHNWRACQSALLLAERLGEFGEAQRNMPLRTRVGLHSGVASVGNIGSRDRFAYTAIGDTTNLASRLEGLNKFLDTQILASVDLVKDIKDRIVTRRVGRFKFKGFGRAIDVYEIVGTPATPAAAAARPWIDRFEAALNLFAGRHFNQAEQAFRDAITQRQEIEQRQLPVEFRFVDGPARVYLRQIELFRSHPPPKEWIGEIHMDEK